MIGSEPSGDAPCRRSDRVQQPEPTPAMNTNPNRTPVRLLALAALGALAAISLSTAGCRDERSDEPPHQFLPDMDDSPKFKPQTETEFFADGRAMRPAVKGAV